MTNIKYSKRFKLRNGERIDFCPECDYHITDTVNNSDSVYCPKCGQQIQLLLQRDIEGNAIMINGCAGGDIR